VDETLDHCFLPASLPLDDPDIDVNHRFRHLSCFAIVATVGDVVVSAPKHPTVPGKVWRTRSSELFRNDLTTAAVANLSRQAQNKAQLVSGAVE